MSETVLDLCGTTCPVPVLKTKKALAGLASGARLRVVCTDPASVADLAQFARQTGHRLLRQFEEDGKFVHLFERR